MYTDCRRKARIFLREVIASHGIPKIVISDKQSAFTAQFFKNLSKMLGFQHRTSASRTARSNGLAESLVQRVTTLMKTYDKPDVDVEDVVPLIEMSLRVSNHTRFHMPLRCFMGDQCI